MDEGALVEFSYISQVAAGLTPAAMLRLARQAWSFNTRHGLTGILHHEDGKFVQIIEGSCEQVLALSSRIMTDRRHNGIAVTAFRAIPARRFAAWTISGFDVGSHEVVAAGPGIVPFPQRSVPAAAPAVLPCSASAAVAAAQPHP